MPSVKAKISGLTNKILNKNPPENEKMCYHTRKTKCFIHGKYLSNDILHIATLTLRSKNYEPRTKKSAKSHSNKLRYAGTIINNSISKTTARKLKLPSNIWNYSVGIKLQTSHLTSGKYTSCNSGSQKGILCLNKKLESNHLLNERTETIVKCRHQHKSKLASFETGKQNRITWNIYLSIGNDTVTFELTLLSSFEQEKE